MIHKYLIIGAAALILALCFISSAMIIEDGSTSEDSILLGDEAVTHTVTFDTNGGSPLATQTIPDGGKVQSSPAPTKEGYGYDVICTDKECTQMFDFNTPITSDTTLYVKWYDDSIVIRDCTLLSVQKNITSIEIPLRVDRIGTNAFENCTALTSITIRDSIRSIEQYAFRNCTSLTEIEILGATELRGHTFENCSALKSIDLTNVTGYLSYVFHNCTSLTKVILPENLIHISNNIFWNCTSLASIVIPDSVASIGSEAFWNCTSLASIVIPDSVASIGSEAFRNCTSLASIVVPDSVTSIGDYVFYNCTSLESITFENAETLPSLGVKSLNTRTNTEILLKPDVYKPSETDSFSQFENTHDSYTVLSIKSNGVVISFDSNGGSETASQTIASGEKPVRPEEPVKDGYVFGGWYTDAELTTEYTFTTLAAENITLYAKWYDELAFTTVPSIQNVKITVDGRTITATATAENFEYLLWDMGDGSEPVKTYTNSIAYTYSSDGDYTVKVTAYNGKGHSETISQDVSVSEGNSDKSDDQNGGRFSTLTMAGIILIVFGAILTIISLIRFNLRILKPGLILIVAGIIIAIFGGFL